MSDLKRRIDDVAALMDEFGLESARLRDEDWCIELSRVPVGGAGTPVVMAVSEASAPAPAEAAPRPAPAAKTGAPKGTPITSPMTGVFYITPNPGAPPYVKEGDTVTAGQAVCVIEAMKVLNEVTATVSGTVLKICLESGTLVQPGEVLLYIG